MRDKATFTLIELLIVIAIIGILLSILLPSMQKAKDKAKIAVELSYRKQLYQATAMYANNNNDNFPARQNIGGLHQMIDSLASNAVNINKVLIDKYCGEGPEIRDKMLFCQSKLLEKRNSSTGSYKDRFCTLNYFVIPSSGSLYLSDFQNKSLAISDPDNALWACLALKKGATTWFGHDAPVVNYEPKGSSTVFVDGGASWIRPSNMKMLWGGSWGLKYYLPMR